MIITFVGHSDDTFGSNVEDHDNCASGKPIVYRLSHGDDSVLVWGQYAPDETDKPCWVVGISPDEAPDRVEKAIPLWPMRFERSDREYSAALVIEAPDGTVQTRVFPAPSDDEDD